MRPFKVNPQVLPLPQLVWHGIRFLRNAGVMQDTGKNTSVVGFDLHGLRLTQADDHGLGQHNDHQLIYNSAHVSQSTTWKLRVHIIGK